MARGTTIHAGRGGPPHDTTPHGTGVFHINRIRQPATSTPAPVVGVAITTEVPVPGSGTGATPLDDVESAVRFCIEVAKAFGEGQCRFHDEEEFAKLRSLDGDMTHLQDLEGKRE